MSENGGGEPLLSAREVTKHFPIKEGTLIQREVARGAGRRRRRLDCSAGETLGLVGESGCGKSTLGRCAGPAARADRGHGRRSTGRDITTLSRAQLRPLRREMQMVFQDPYASLNPRKRVGRSSPTRCASTAHRAARSKRETQELLERVGLSPEHYNRYPHEFSGGQRQRIGIARALALNPKLIVADEPVSALDVSIQAQVVNLLEDLQDEFGLTYLFIAHDLAVVRHVSDRIAVMYLGKIVELSPAEELYQRPIHPYTEALLSAVPIPDPELARSASGSCSRATCPARSRRRAAAASIPAAATRPRSARPTSRRWSPHGDGHLAACHHPLNVGADDPAETKGSDPVVSRWRRHSCRPRSGR